VGLIVGMDVTEVGNIFLFKGNDDIFLILFQYFYIGIFFAVFLLSKNYKISFQFK
jgi:hypothetical protein